MKLLIVASQLDPHADAVIKHLHDFLCPDSIFRLDLEASSLNQKVIVRGSADSLLEWDIECIHTARKLSSRENIFVWWRRTHSSYPASYLEVPSIEQLDQAETYWAVRWAVESLPEHRFPLGHPNSLRRAENKFIQHSAAVQSGFKVPNSIWTNCLENASAFAMVNDPLVVKPIHTSIYRESNVDSSLYAKKVSSDHVLHAINDEPFALYLQKCIAKQSDVRLNILPHISVSCRISSNELEDDEVDWRPRTMDLTHSIIETPPHIESAARKYLKLMNLSWGAFDFAIDDHGEWWFLECNSNGQWLWIEALTGYPLSKYFAESICHSTKDSS